MKLKRGRQNDDPVKMIYHVMLKYQGDRNRANTVHELRSKYNLPLSEENVCSNISCIKKW